MSFHRDSIIGDIHVVHQFSAASTVAMNALAVVAGDIGKLVRRTDTGQWFLLQNNVGPVWIDITSQGGGGGGGVQWRGGTGYSNPSPVEDVEYNNRIFKFIAGGGQSLYTTLKVPSSYQAGTQVKMRLDGYSPSVANNFKLKSVSTLIQIGVDAASSVTDQYNSTNAALTNSGVADKLVLIEIDLSNASGQINSVAIAAGDEIQIELLRDAADTDTADIRFRPDSTTFITTA